MMTVAELFPDVKGQIGTAGACDSSTLMKAMNVVGPELLNRIDAKGTLWTWCFCICNSCVILPSEMLVPRQAWYNGQSLGFRSEFWLGRLGGDIDFDLEQEVPWQELVDTGRRSITQAPINAGKSDVFFLVARSQSDAGKEVEVRYRTSAGREIVWLVSLNGDHKASSSSETNIGELIRFRKPRTSGAVELWVLNLANGMKRLVSVYDGHEETPEYPVMELTRAGWYAGTLIVKGKRKWLPLRSDQDLVPFGSVMTWRSALSAESASAAKDTKKKREFLGDALAHLDEELEALRPPGQGQTVSFITPWTLLNKRRTR